METLTLDQVLIRHENKRLLPIFNRLRQVNELIPHLQWCPATHKTYDKFLPRLTEPKGSWQAIAEGYERERSSVGMILEPIGKLGTMSEIPDDLLRVSADPGMLRYGEDSAFMSGLTKTMTASVFYASQAHNPKSFDGMSVRYNALSKFNVEGGGAGGTSTQSIWVVTHSVEDGLCVIYPSQSTSAGITMMEEGSHWVDQSTTDNRRLKVHLTTFGFQMGLRVMDHRSVLRYANLATGGSSNQFTLTKWIDLIKESWDRSRTVSYITRDMWAQVQKAAMNTANAHISYPKDTLGREVMAIFGIPTHMVEQLGSETAIS